MVWRSFSPTAKRTFTHRARRNDMKKIIVGLCTVFIMALFLNVHAKSTHHCVKAEPFWGKSCGNKDSMNVRIRNNCSESVYVKVCVERTSGKWSCGSDSGLEAGTTNAGFYTCHATGNYEWRTCTGGYSECGFKKN